MQGFDVFDEDDLPFNSDVTMIFEQYLNCLEKLRGDNVVSTDFESTWYWKVDGEKSYIRTAAPKKIKNR